MRKLIITPLNFIPDQQFAVKIMVFAEHRIEVKTKPLFPWLSSFFNKDPISILLKESGQKLTQQAANINADALISFQYQIIPLGNSLYISSSALAVNFK